jgi:hypothetical protein
LGNGSTTPSSTPVEVSGLSSGVKAVSVGLYHACALTTAGAVKCWGYNGTGELGNGSDTTSSTPVAVSGLSSGVTAISVGGDHACALASGGAVECWGSNFFGQIGDSLPPPLGPEIEANTPHVAISGGATAVSAGAAHTCAVLSSGGVECWGLDNYGELGTTVDASNPIHKDVNGDVINAFPLAVDGLSSGVTQVSTGDYHTCVVKTDGAVECWGWNEFGQLGANVGGGGVTKESPGSPQGVLTSVAGISAGWDETCGVTTDGGAKCWGDNQYGALGGGSPDDTWTPTNVTLEPAPPPDSTPPVVMPMITGTLGTNGWYTSDVQIGWNVNDPDSAILSQSGCGTGTVTADTSAGETFTCTATSEGGTTTDSVTIKRDATLPTLDCTVPDQQRWYGAGVTVTCTAGDDGSGLKDTNDASFSLSTNVSSGDESADAETGSRQVCDLAGNCVGAGPYAFRVDEKAPTLQSCDASDGNWHAANVTLYCTYTDGGSGPASQKVALATAVASGNETSNGVASSGGSHACDAVGNCAASPADIPGNKVDRKAPAIVCNAAAFMLDQSPANATATATDGGSGPSSQTLSAAADTSTAGLKSVTLTATDSVGNSSSRSCPYSVGYGFAGFMSPLSKTMLLKSGSTIPVKFVLTDATGSPLPPATASALAETGNVEAILMGPGIAPQTSLCTWNTAGGLYFQCNIKTPGGLKTGTSNPYTLTTALNLGSGFTTIPPVGSAVNAETVYFK